MADIVQQIRDRYPTLSSAKKSVASYFLNHFHTLQFATVTELAERIGVSDTTIINLCADLGYSGFSGFKKAVRAWVREEADGGTPAAGSSDQSSFSTVRSLTMPLLQALSDTFSDAQNCDAISRAAQMLAGAKKIYAIGFWGASAMAQEFCLQLRRKGRSAEAIFPDLGDYIDKVLQTSAEDVVVMYDFARYFAALNEICRVLKERGVPIILITDMGPCPCLPFAAMTIHCHTPENHRYAFPQAATVGYLLRILSEELMPPRESDYETLREGVFTRFNNYGVIEPGADYTTRV